jgi:hypothetical protein
MVLHVDEFTVIEGGKHALDAKEYTPGNAAARSAGGLLITTSHKNPSGIGLSWPQVLGVIPYDTDTLAIIGSFCLVTLYGSGAATFARPILDRRVSELREGSEFHGGRIERITIEGNLSKLRNSM